MVGAVDLCIRLAFLGLRQEKGRVRMDGLFRYQLIDSYSDL